MAGTSHCSCHRYELLMSDHRRRANVRAFLCRQVDLTPRHRVNTVRWGATIMARFYLTYPGSEPFELTKRFFDMTAGAFPAFNMFIAYGRSAPLYLEPPACGEGSAISVFLS